MRAGSAVINKEELIGIALVVFIIITLIVLFVAFRKTVFQKNYSRNNLSLVQDPATAALLNKANGIQFQFLNCTPGDPFNLYTETGLGPAMVGPPQVPVRPLPYTPCFQRDPRCTLEKSDRCVVEHTEMSTFHPESPRSGSGTIKRGVVVCVPPSLSSVLSCQSDCESICKSTWDNDEGECLFHIVNIWVLFELYSYRIKTIVLIRPCFWHHNMPLVSGSHSVLWKLFKVFYLTFFPTDKTADTADEVICYSASNKNSNSEVQSLNSFQSDSCDDNGKIHIQRKIL